MQSPPSAHHEEHWSRGVKYLNPKIILLLRLFQTREQKEICWRKIWWIQWMITDYKSFTDHKLIRRLANSKPRKEYSQCDTERGLCQQLRTIQSSSTIHCRLQTLLQRNKRCFSWFRYDFFVYKHIPQTLMSYLVVRKCIEGSLLFFLRNE